MIANTHITIYNKYIEDRAEKWQRSVVRDVNWQDTKAVMGTKQGLLASNVATIFIPMSNNTEYLAPKAWQALESKSSAWTLQEGDIVVRGEVEDEITPADDDTPAVTIKSLYAKYDHVAQITSIDAMDMGSPNMRHWEVGVK